MPDGHGQSFGSWPWQKYYVNDWLTKVESRPWLCFWAKANVKISFCLEKVQTALTPPPVSPSSSLFPGGSCSLAKATSSSTFWKYSLLKGWCTWNVSLLLNVQNIYLSPRHAYFKNWMNILNEKFSLWPVGLFLLIVWNVWTIIVIEHAHNGGAIK